RTPDEDLVASITEEVRKRLGLTGAAESADVTPGETEATAAPAIESEAAAAPAGGETEATAGEPGEREPEHHERHLSIGHAEDLVRGHKSVPMFIVSVVVLVGLAVAAGLVIVALHFRSERNQAANVANARDTALAAAKTYAVAIGTYNWQHLDQDFQIVLDHSTSSFQTSYKQSSGALKTDLVKFHATSNATVVAEGVESATTTRVVVLVFLDQTVTNSTQKAPTTDRSQLEMTLLWQHNGWFINNVTLL
ncbi:MAG TPA: hypothetical protein VGS21_06580, partial [Acidimicrobiales bacterium]|nr:hypothetical protein [Acidimicrobiales bacterium]